MLYEVITQPLLVAAGAERYAARQQLPLEEARARLASAYDKVAGTLEWYCLDYWQTQLA